MSLAHWLIVLVIVLLLFGASRLSDVGKGLGEGIKNFKKGLKEDGEDDEDAAPKPVKRKVIDAEEVEEVKATPKQLTTGARVTAAAGDDDEEEEIIVVKKKKKKTITVEVDDDADEEEVQRKVAAARRQAAAEKDA